MNDEERDNPIATALREAGLLGTGERLGLVRERVNAEGFDDVPRLTLCLGGCAQHGAITEIMAAVIRASESTSDWPTQRQLLAAYVRLAEARRVSMRSSQPQPEVVK